MEIFLRRRSLAQAPTQLHFEREQLDQQLGRVASRSPVQLVLDPRPPAFAPGRLVALARRVDPPGPRQGIDLGRLAMFAGHGAGSRWCHSRQLPAASPAVPPEPDDHPASGHATLRWVSGGEPGLADQVQAPRHRPPVRSRAARRSRRWYILPAGPARPDGATRPPGRRAVVGIPRRPGPRIRASARRRRDGRGLRPPPSHLAAGMSDSRRTRPPLASGVLRDGPGPAPCGT